MARIKIEGILEDMDSDIRRALRDAIKEVSPSSNIDEYALFRAFKRLLTVSVVHGLECLTDM
jgi:hypothetical protein